MTFKEKYQAGEIEFEAIDDYVDEWNNSDDERTLAKFLGLNADEEDAWIDDGDEALKEMLDAGKLEQGRERCLCGRIWLLLSMLEHMESAGPRGSDYVLRAVNWMQTNYMNPVSISALAGELNLDRSYFSTLFRRQTGRSPQQYLTELRLEKARTLLLEYGYRPGEAAQAVGYADIFSFSRMFKRRYGVSPSALRR